MYGQQPGAYGQAPHAAQTFGQPGQAAQATQSGAPPTRRMVGAGASGRLGIGMGVLVIAGVVALTFVLPSFGILVSAVGLVVLGTLDRIRPYGDAALGAAVVAALWRAVAVFAGAVAITWAVETVFEIIARARFAAGHLVTIRDTPSSTVLAAFTALAVLLVCAVPRWRAPSRALARLISGAEGSAPVVRYALMAACALAIVAALFAPAPSWWPLPFDSSLSFSSVIG